MEIYMEAALLLKPCGPTPRYPNILQGQRYHHKLLGNDVDWQACVDISIPRNLALALKQSYDD